MPKDALDEGALLRLSERRKGRWLLAAAGVSLVAFILIYTYVRETQLDAHGPLHC